MHWQEVAGADFVASHDLGRPNGAGSRRMRHLDKTGASVLFATARLANVDWLEAAGHVAPEWAEQERDFWNRNLASALMRVARNEPCQ